MGRNEEVQLQSHMRIMSFKNQRGLENCDPQKGFGPVHLGACPRLDHSQGQNAKATKHSQTFKAQSSSMAKSGSL